MVVVAYLLLLFFPFASLIYSAFGIFYNPSNWKKYITFFIYALFIGAYVFEPHSYINYDLTRYIPDIEEFGKLTLFEALEKNRDFLFSRDILFWFFGKLNIPHMVPAVTTSVFMQWRFILHAM